MHESIATAHYKGFSRKLKDREIDLARVKNAPKTRAAFLRWVAKYEQTDPRLVLFHPPKTLGEGKHTKLMCFGALFEKDVDRQYWSWTGYLSVADAKTFDFDAKLLNVVATNHLVERIMQRLNTSAAAAAVRSLEPAFKAALSLGMPGKESLLLPGTGGAVVAVQDREYPRDWALVTFIDAAKLRPEQRREVEHWSEQANRAVDARVRVQP